MTTVVRAPTIDMVRFLLARVDEDETQLKRIVRTRARSGATVMDDPGVFAVNRQLAEVVMKRKLLASVQQLIVLRDQPMEKAVRDQGTEMLMAMATPYVTHRSFPRGWHEKPR